MDLEVSTYFYQLNMVVERREAKTEKWEQRSSWHQQPIRLVPAQLKLIPYIHHGWYWVNGHDSETDLLEVPTIYKAYFSGLNFREYPHNSYGPKSGTVPPF